MAEYKTPGVYIEEIVKFPPSIASVETAIPVFIGYTATAQNKSPNDLRDVPTRISSMLEYNQIFGGPQVEEGSITVNVDSTQPQAVINAVADPLKTSKYLMAYQLQMFFNNGGGPCYIVSVGDYSTGTVSLTDLTNGLNNTEKIDEITLILFPDAINMTDANSYYILHKSALDMCQLLGDRFTVMDVWMDPSIGPADNIIDHNVTLFRNADFGDIDTKKYGAIYFPRVNAQLPYTYDANTVTVKQTGGDGSLNGTLAALKSVNNAFYYQALNAISLIPILLPASCGVVGKYAETDNTRGVWKAPANIGINNAISPEVIVTNRQQEDLNVDVKDGKSVNVIRTFPGRGPAIIWGARTLAGNDNEWRYISVRRFFSMVEESVKNATQQFVFEPNDLNTWVRVKSMIENYLTQQWKAGALMGTTTREAFFVKVGLGETMTELDIWEGRMIVEIGMAAVRPAEFIILRFSHKMLQES
ncbi:phage tail sheath C-terminal domain-containing protein [Chitinophaga sp. 212800010-3]|uniref:phage tail sheath family protein n=1 Tax=unclassified Chitinophaga TaxID=2619133 RepID=UPI002DF6EEB8|nr:Phage tail sheath family protein [Chitinophaga sp. 212800010-3]